MSKITNDFVSLIVWIACGLTISFLSFRYKIGTMGSPGPGFMPLLAGLAITLCALVGLVKTILDQKGTVGWKPIRGVRWGRALITLAALLGYAALLERLGFILCTIAFIGFLFRIIKPMKWHVVIGGSLIVTVVAYGIFELWLQTQLPKGPWGF